MYISDNFKDRCELEFEGCTVQFYFSTDISVPIEIENSDDYSCPAATVPWIIAGSLVGAILLLGLLGLIILKMRLVFLVSTYAWLIATGDLLFLTTNACFVASHLYKPP